MAPRIVHISKLLSLMLRHRPDEFGLQVDRYGFADLDEVLRAFQDRNSTFTLEDIEKVVYDGEKQRFEIVENRIRARYGHSFPSIWASIHQNHPNFCTRAWIPPMLSDYYLRVWYQMIAIMYICHLTPMSPRG